jgi:hypothetical protein
MQPASNLASKHTKSKQRTAGSKQRTAGIKQTIVSDSIHTNMTGSSEYIHPVICLPASQPASQPTNQPTNQPASQPAIRSKCYSIIATAVKQK